MTRISMLVTLCPLLCLACVEPTQNPVSEPPEDDPREQTCVAETIESDSMVVAGVGATGVGPLPITIGRTLPLDRMGPPNQGLLLLTGPLNPGATTVPGLGSVDLGTPPNFQDIGVIFDGTVGAGSVFYRTDAMGLATQTFTLPPLPPGLFVPVQGLVIQTPGTSAFGSLFTAAFTLAS